jgi:hypothetical protein
MLMVLFAYVGAAMERLLLLRVKLMLQNAALLSVIVVSKKVAPVVAT